MNNDSRTITPSATDQAREMIQEVQHACPPADWPEVLEVLRVLAVLSGEYPTPILYEILGKSEDDVLRLVGKASGIVQTTETGRMVLRPPEVGEVVASSVFTSQPELAKTLREVVRVVATHVVPKDPWADYCGRNLGKYLAAAGDPQLTVAALGDGIFGRQLQLGYVSVAEVIDLLLLRARAAQELNATEPMNKALLMAGTLARAEQCQAASGDLLLDLWRNRTAAVGVAPDVPCKTTEEGVVLLLALAEAATHSQGEHMLDALHRLCSTFRQVLQEKPNQCVIEVLDRRWASRYAGEVVAALAGKNATAALQVHEVLLLGGRGQRDQGTFFDYTAQLLGNLGGDQAGLSKQILKLTIDRSVELIPDLPESPSFPLSAIDGKTFSPDEREQEKRDEALRAQYLNATAILRRTPLASKQLFISDLERRLDRLWKEADPIPSVRLDHLMRFHDAVGTLPDKWLGQLSKTITADLGSWHITPYDDCRNWLRACPLLGRERTAQGVSTQVVEAVMEHPLAEILFQWPLVTDFNFCGALLKVASLGGEGKLKETWDRLWKSAAKLPSRSGERLAALAKLLEEGSTSEVEAVGVLMLESLSRGRFAEGEKLALRASLSVTPGTGGDHELCGRVLASLTPVKTDCGATVPSPEALASFLAMCLDERLFDALEFISQFGNLAEGYGLSDHDRRVFFKLICRHVKQLSERRALINAARGVFSAGEHLELCLAVEDARSGTLIAGDLKQESTGSLGEDDFATMLDVVMSAGAEQAEAMLARISSIREAASRAIVVHKYIRHAKKIPQFEAKHAIIMLLPANEVVSAAVAETTELDLATLKELEGFIGFNLAGFRILHQASLKVAGCLPEAFVSRQVERLIPSLRSKREHAAGSPSVAGDKEEEFKHSDGVDLADEILRCGKVEDQLSWVERILGELPACGRWVMVGFLDRIASLLKSQSLPKGLLKALAVLPQDFDEKYHRAFYARILRYLGDSNAQARTALWTEVRGLWIGGDSVSKRAALLANGCNMMPPGDVGEEIRGELIAATIKVLKEADDRGKAGLFALLSLLLPEIGEWRSLVEGDLNRVVGTVLDSARSLGKEVSDDMMTDAIKGFGETAKDEGGLVFLERVCTAVPSRWTVLLEVFGARCDSDGDLVTEAEDLMETLVSKAWPGEEAVRAWLARFSKWDGEDRVFFAADLAPALAASPYGQKWAQLLDNFIVSAKPEPPKDRWREFIAYGRSQVGMALLAKDPENNLETHQPVFSDRDDYKRAWLCLRAAPRVPSQQDMAVALFQRLIELDPPLGTGSSGRDVAFELVSELFSEHEWRSALAAGALEALSNEASIAKRLHYTLAVAKGLRSAAALRSALDLFTHDSLDRALRGATPEDLKVLIGAASVFQVRSLYQAVDSAELGGADEEIRAMQRHAAIYRRWCLDERETGGPCWNKLALSYQSEAPTARLEAAAFAEKDAQWAREIATAVESSSNAIQNEDLPVQYWWRLARCARLTQSTEIVRLLARFRRRMPAGTALPEDVITEIGMILHDSVKSARFPEIFGLIETFFFSPEPGSSQSSVALPARLQMQLTAAANLLN